ncbi:MAG: carbon-nitrogen hydrolase family protein [Bacteroidales bacterium]|nr:carbon-nitrogen hydrolase family protein [Bacteroidales bacterium]
MKTNRVSRRKFLRRTALTTGMASLSSLGLISSSATGTSPDEDSGHEVWISGICQMGLRTKTSGQMVERILAVLKEAIVYEPDFVCLPEVFPFQGIEQRMTLPEMIETSEKVVDQFSAFSKQNNCYVICPVYTEANGSVFNSAVVLDRSGRKIGSYNKIHPTEGEIEEGIAPGAMMQPVIQTEFGPIGVQICFDINWTDGWNMLRGQHARIIFWPSAYGGGITVNTKAWQNRCIVASSTHKGTSRLCDITGEIITQTGQWNPNLYCGPVNMEKAFLATWPYVSRFREIEAKYGRKVRITNYHEEEWSIIESLSPGLYVKDILKEFELKTYEEHIGSGEALQKKTRK